jgi:hypothetical protein
MELVSLIKNMNGTVVLVMPSHYGLGESGGIGPGILRFYTKWTKWSATCFGRSSSEKYWDTREIK